MTIRAAIDSDIPSIVVLLKTTLGESLMPKSEEFWRWKHIENPFGQSPVLLAIDGHDLVGVRAFMRWDWKAGNGIYKAVRAVDTATHPDYQGRGIFRTLTMALVDQCRSEGVDFIFNTPNQKSKPGYIKMGWHSLRRMPVQVYPILSIAGSRDFESRYRFNGEYLTSFLQDDDAHALDSEGGHLVSGHQLSTLLWRYQQNPNVQYHLFGNKERESRYLTIFRLKQSRFGLEFRICDLILRGSMGTYKKHLTRMAKEAGARFITYAGAHHLFPVSLPLGPEITVRQLQPVNSLSFAKWRPTLGDMEVF